MLVKRIFVEHQVATHPQTGRILRALDKAPVVYIDKVEDVFERARKPYLQKRGDLNLFIGRKEGQLVKPAPDAYGLSGDPHYYFIHAYNCIYECEYCYLQGYFKSPDLVLYVNHDEIAAEIRETVRRHADRPSVWFHAGEFSDTLALSHITDEWGTYWELFATLPNARLELRTKSVNLKAIIDRPPLENIIVTFSLSPAAQAKRYDRKTPSLEARLRAIAKLADRGFRLGIHFDPIIYDDGFEAQYRALVQEVLQAVPDVQIEYISLGVVRFTRDVYQEFVRNYPGSGLLAGEFVKSFDNKIRYNRPQRLYMLNTVQQLCRDAGIGAEKIYLCMENETV